MVSESCSRDIAKGTCVTQLSNTVKHLQEVTATLQEGQSRHGLLMEGILQQLNNMVASYVSLVHVNNRGNSREDTS